MIRRASFSRLVKLAGRSGAAALEARIAACAARAADRGSDRRCAACAGASWNSAVVRFAGDSGDGVQLTGAQFTLATALAGNDLETFPDFPAEIRAPVGTTFGVSAFQINFGARRIYTVGDRAGRAGGAQSRGARRSTCAELKPGGVVILDQGSFDERSLRKAGLAADPREDGTLDGYRVVPVDISANTKAATRHTGLSSRDQLRCKNFYALGLVYWMFERDRAPTVRWLEQRFKDRPDLAAANIAALARRPRAGRDRRAAPAAGLPRRAGARRTRPLPHHHRPRGPGLRPARRCPQGRARRWSSAPTRSRRPRPCSTTWPSCAARASPPSRPRTRSPPPAPPSAHPTPAASASPPAPAPASRSRPRPSASPSPPSCRWSSSTPSAAARPPACRPRPSSPTSTRRSWAATATRRSSSWPRPRRRTASPWRARRCASPSTT